MEKQKKKSSKEAQSEHDKSIIPYRVFEGNVPSNMILLDHLTPHSLGMLIALYEHKVFVQGVIWNLNSFDQWGVELGKKLANEILDDLVSDKLCSKHDSSTEGLINYFRSSFLDKLAS